MASKLSVRSKAILDGVHPDLVKVVLRASEMTPFIVTEGCRSLARQKELVRKGASRTLKSRHLTGHAVDLCDVKATYNMGDMRRISAAMKAAAAELDVPIEWGGDWKSFVDTPHFQLPHKAYPASNPIPLTTEVTEAARVAVSPRVVTGAGVGATAVAASPEAAVETVTNIIPAPPASWTDAVANLELWQIFGGQLWALKNWAVGSPLMAGTLLIVCTVIAFWPKNKEHA